MRLVTAGVPLNLNHAVVGIVSTQPVMDLSRRSKSVLVSANLGGLDLNGYRAVLTTAEVGSSSVSVPALHKVRDIDHLKDGFIVALEPTSGFVRTVYRPHSQHNILFA